MKRFWWTYLLLTVFGLLQAETLPVQLKWNEPCVVTGGSVTYVRPCFDNDLPHDGLPYYSCRIDGQAQDGIRLTDAVFEPCTPQEIALLQDKTIDDSIRIVQYNTSARGVRQTEIEFLPIIRRNNTYQRLVSAQLQISRRPQMRAGNPSNVYAPHSKLSTGRWVKIAVEKTGIQALSYSDLRSMGFENPSKVRVFGYGGYPIANNFSEVFPRTNDDLVEQPTLTTTNTSGEQQIIFYGKGATNLYFDAVAAFYRRINNPYSDLGYYFLTTDAGEGLHVGQAELLDEEISANLYKTYLAQLYEDDKFNLLSSGQDFLGDKFSNVTPSRSYTFERFPSRCDDVIHVFARTYSTAGRTETFYSPTCFDVTINGSFNENMICMPRVTSGTSATSGQLNSDFIDNGHNPVVIDFAYKNQAASDEAYLDYAIVSAACHLTIPADGQIDVFYPSGLPPGMYARYHITNANAKTQIWNITDPDNLERMQGDLVSGTFSFTAPYDFGISRRYVAFDPTSTKLYKPTFVKEVKNQDLHGLGDVDMVIISPTAYLSEAYRLADFHYRHDGLSVVVVTPEQTYNEFTSGTPDPAAYRLLMKMLYDRAGGSTSRMPRSLLLMGVSTYDNRGRVLPKQEILSYQDTESFKTDVTYCTDDYFGFLDDTEGGDFRRDKLDIAVGRLPVYSLDELKTVVDKIIAYAENDNYTSWRNQIVLLGDDGDENMHTRQANLLADSLADINGGYQYNKIFLDAYPLVQSASGGSYPAAREKVLNSLKNGALVFTYVGHSSPNTLSAEQTINRNDILNMYNSEMAFWFTASCEFSRFDDGKVSSGMQVLTTPHAGIGLVSAARVVYSDQNYRLMNTIFRHLLPKQGEEPLSIGEVYRLGKVNLGDDDNKLRYFLLADPELKLNYPRQTVVTDSINGALPEDAQMQALGLVTVDGHINGIDGELDDNFNGTVAITVYDKAETLSTLANREGAYPFQYTDYPNMIFKGNAAVTNGKFSSTFMIPKDISYRIGNGKIVYYAAAPDHGTDANGFNYDFRVGGSDPDAIFSDQGPDARIYLNTPKFADGQEVDNTPVFYAHTYDEYGINAVGTGIGHDITIRLNNDKNYTFVLNEYYESDLGSYKCGKIRYQLPELPDGKYHLDFKVWNLQNVSTTRSLDFVVNSNCKPVIDTFYCTPNPATDYVWLIYEYDRPNDPIEAEFTLYNLVGQQCWQATSTEFTEGRVAVKLDLGNTQNARLCPGIYPIKLKITTKEGAFCYKTLKLVLQRH
ncbi:MAG: type IX secretion system sortase PorU [Paludibacteraceae bacterium]|nr:type IX secretion system sortase PorU [Paludibacteraceae bacterium]